MKKCNACGKMAHEQATQCPSCGETLPVFGGGAAAPPPPPPAAYSAAPLEAGSAADGMALPQGSVQLGEYASFWIRLGAYLIDNVIVSVVSLPFGVIAAMMNFSQASMEGPSSPSAGSFAIQMVGNLAALIVWVGNSIYLQGTRGASLGKRMCKIVVLNDQGEVLGIGRTVLREIFKIISGCVCLLGYLWMLWDPERQTWHDKVAGSYVYYD